MSSADAVVEAAPSQPTPSPGTLGGWARLYAQDRWEFIGRVAFVAVAVAAVVQRYIFVFFMHEPRKFVWSDMQGYVDRAFRLGMPGVTLNRFDTFYPPGAHMLMAPLMRLARDRETGMLYNQWLWWVLASVTVVAVGLMGWKLFRHPLAGALAMGALMLHWSFTVFAGLFMSENPFSCFMAVALLLGLVAQDMDPRRPVPRAVVYGLAGLVAGMATIIRPQFGIGAALIGLPLLQRRFPFVRFVDALPLGILWVLPVIGAMQLNSHAAGIKMGLSGNAGFNFYQGHCDVVHVETHAADGGGWYAFAAPVRIQRVVNEGKPEKKVVIRGHMAWENDYFFDEGFKCIRADGWAHLLRIYTNVEDLFSPADVWPPNSGRFARPSNLSNHFYSHALLFFIPLALLLALYRRPERWLLIQLATLLPVGLIFYGDSRYRVPYDMFGVLILAGVILAMMGLRRDQRRIPGVGWVDHPVPRDR